MQSTSLPVIDRTTLLAGLREKISARQPIIGRHLIPQSEEGAVPPDLFALYHTAKFPQHGLMGGLLAFGDANKIVLELAGDALAEANGAPVLAGVSAADPFRLIPIFLKEIKEAGFAGVQNFPSMGIMDGAFRSHLESSGGGYNKEIELIRLAREFDLLTAPLVFNTDEAARMTEAGADILVINAPLNASSYLKRKNAGEQKDVLEGLKRTVEAAKKIRPDVILLFGSYWPDDLKNARSHYDSCPGLDGYWTTGRE
ncbi:MAG TPA: phosphoenolpyruvate hydrolase family protein [Verrucomicrobiae bacterium]|nr:phosphoenolpyruvate hydrolase family protein [Verrucomicrobiae bacterium]